MFTRSVSSVPTYYFARLRFNLSREKLSQQGRQEFSPKFFQAEATGASTRIVQGCWSLILRSLGLRCLRGRRPRLSRHLSFDAGRTTLMAAQTRPTMTSTSAPSPAWTWCCRVPRSSASWKVATISRGTVLLYRVIVGKIPEMRDCISRVCLIEW